MVWSETADGPSVKGDGMIAGVIFAGGEARRMGGIDKPFAMLEGAPLIAWTLARLRSQTDCVAISARAAHERFASLGVDVLTDPADANPTGWGPVAGLLAGLAWAGGLGARWLATAPADAPFLPRDLVAVAVHAAGRVDAPAAIAVSPGGREPACAVWRCAVRDEVRTLVEGGVRALHVVAERVGAAEAWFSSDPEREEPFFNVNTPADLAAAEAIARRLGLHPPPFSAE